MLKGPINNRELTGNNSMEVPLTRPQRLSTLEKCMGNNICTVKRLGGTGITKYMVNVGE